MQHLPRNTYAMENTTYVLYLCRDVTKGTLHKKNQNDILYSMC